MSNFGANKYMQSAAVFILIFYFAVNLSIESLTNTLDGGYFLRLAIH